MADDEVVTVVEAYTDGAAELGETWPQSPVRAGWGVVQVRRRPLVGGFM